MAREQKVNLMRKYRTGELPDVQQLSIAAFLAPLGKSHSKFALSTWWGVGGVGSGGAGSGGVGQGGVGWGRVGRHRAGAGWGQGRMACAKNDQHRRGFTALKGFVSTSDRQASMSLDRAYT